MRQKRQMKHLRVGHDDIGWILADALSVPCRRVPIIDDGGRSSTFQGRGEFIQIEELILGKRL